MSNLELKRACLAVGVAATWSVAGAGQTSPARGVVNTVLDQGPMHFMYTNSSSGGYDGALMTRNSTGLSMFPGDGLDKPFTAQLNYTPGIWTVLGRIDAERVSVGVDPLVAPSLFGSTWEAAFPGWNEATVSAAIASSDYGVLGSFSNDFRPYFSTVFAEGAHVTMVDFSNGTNGGYVSLVPEPTSLVAIGIGLLALRRRRRA